MVNRCYVSEESCAALYTSFLHHEWFFDMAHLWLAHSFQRYINLRRLSGNLRYFLRKLLIFAYDLPLVAGQAANENTTFSFAKWPWPVRARCMARKHVKNISFTAFLIVVSCRSRSTVPILTVLTALIFSISPAYIYLRVFIILQLTF